MKFINIFKNKRIVACVYNIDYVLLKRLPYCLLDCILLVHYILRSDFKYNIHLLLYKLIILCSTYILCI